MNVAHVIMNDAKLSINAFGESCVLGNVNVYGVAGNVCAWDCAPATAGEAGAAMLPV